MKLWIPGTRRLRLGLAVCLLAGLAGFAPRSAPGAGMAHADDPEQGPEPCSPAWLREAPLGTGDLVIHQSPAILPPLTELTETEDTETAEGAQRAAATGDLAALEARAAGLDAADSEVGTQANTRPNDTLFKMYKLNLLVIGALQAWETSYGTDDITIAVIADGVEYTHPDLVDKLWRNPREIPGNRRDDDANGFVDDTIGWDFASGLAPEDNDPMPVPQSQLDVIMPVNGTAIAGIAAADTNNGTGVAGVSWGARIMPLKIFKRDRIQLRQPNARLDPDGDGYYWGTSTDWEHLARAVCYAANNGADVIAFGGLMFYNPSGAGNVLERAQAAITYARKQKGVMLVAGAGECGKDIPGVTWWCPDPARYGANVPAFPAAFEDVIGVQSFDSGYRRRAYEMRPYASVGDWVDLAAPGEGFYTAWRNGDYQEIDGNFKVPSEMAAAHVAGVIAVMKGLNLGFGPMRIEDKLCETASRSPIPADLAGPFDGRSAGGFPRNDRFGCGVVNFERAVEEMPWQVRVMPGKVVHMVDRSESLPKVLLSSTNLNEGHWAIESSEEWLQAESVPQDIGQPSQMEMEIDGDALQRDQGPLQGNRTVKPEVVARAVNIEHPAMAQASTPQKLTYEVYIVDRISHAYLPAVRR